MLTPIVCSSCGHAGATESARLPRILTCAHCGHRALFEAQSVRKRLTRGQQRRAVARFQGRAHEIGPLSRPTLTCPRILTCAHCGHRALFEAQSVRKRLTRGQQRTRGGAISRPSARDRAAFPADVEMAGLARARAKFASSKRARFKARAYLAVSRCPTSATGRQRQRSTCVVANSALPVVKPSISCRNRQHPARGRRARQDQTGREPAPLIHSKRAAICIGHRMKGPWKAVLEPMTLPATRRAWS